MSEIAKVGLACGRWYLSVAGVTVAMEGDTCRDILPERCLDDIPEWEMESATIGGEPIRDMPIEMVRAFRKQPWTEKMLRHVADKINSDHSVDVTDMTAQLNQLAEALVYAERGFSKIVIQDAEDDAKYEAMQTAVITAENIIAATKGGD